MPLDHWYLFPASIGIATIAMASGIGGAVFFSPLFILVLDLEPAVAIGTALMTELFGFSSGLLAYWRRRLIDFRLGRNLLLVAVPAAVVGSLSADILPSTVLKTAFAVGIILIGSQLYSSIDHDEQRELDDANTAQRAVPHSSRLVDRAGREYRYTICHKDQGMVFAGIGGAFLGAISVGLAELQEYHLIVRCRIPSPVAVATSIFIVVVTVFVASLGHAYRFATGADPQVLAQVGEVVMFTIPGVIIGGQIGPFVQATVNPDLVKRGIAVLFVLVGGFMLSTVI